MAIRENAREQNNTTQQSSTRNQQNQQDPRAGATQVAATDRERPIESRREGERQDRDIVRHRGTSPAYGGVSSPFTLMRRMAEDMDRLFEQFGFGRPAFGPTPRFGSLLDDQLWSDRSLPSTTALWSPQVETFRTGDNLVIRADVPGVKKEDIHVDIENDTLTISGERREEHEENRDDYYRSERSYGQFYRAIPLPEGVNTEKCDASFKDGVLEVTLPAPQQEERKAKRIQVK
jgi:HSP20 family protein